MWVGRVNKFHAALGSMLEHGPLVETLSTNLAGLLVQLEKMTPEAMTPSSSCMSQIKEVVGTAAVHMAAWRSKLLPGATAKIEAQLIKVMTTVTGAWEEVGAAHSVDVSGCVHHWGKFTELLREMGTEAGTSM